MIYLRVSLITVLEPLNILMQYIRKDLKTADGK